MSKGNQLMGEMTIKELMRGVIDLYHAGSYDLAYGLLTREGNHFPDNSTRIFYWRLCLASKAGRYPLAVSILKDALNAGIWYPAEQLQDDEDLRPLQDNEEFENLVKLCKQRHAEAQAKARPSLVTVKPELFPEGSETKIPLFIALHGDYNNANQTIPHWKTLPELGQLLAIPQSTQVGTSEGFIWDDFMLSEQEIIHHYKALRKQYPIDPKRILMGGFSLGGTLAIWLTLTRAIPATGFIVIGPYLPKKFSWLPLIESCQDKKLRGYIIIGKQDTDCYQGAVTMANQLKAHNVPCELEIHPKLGHDFPPDFDQILSKAVKFLSGD
ncbi:MAG: dienelactone hydrolase family protein [Anaerolineaceae bacterium]|nr:dienelactone hydrolase family protein [Anaerolineaceae bacterium]